MTLNGAEPAGPGDTSKAVNGPEDTSQTVAGPGDTSNAAAGPEDTTKAHSRLSLTSRTFATSNYKRFYSGAEPSPFQHDLLHAVNDMLMLFARRMNPTLDEETVQDGVHTLMKKIQRDASG